MSTPSLEAEWRRELPPELSARWSEEFATLPHAHALQFPTALLLRGALERSRHQHFLVWRRAAAGPGASHERRLVGAGLVRVKRWPFLPSTFYLPRGPVVSALNELDAVLAELEQSADIRKITQIRVGPYFMGPDVELASAILESRGYRPAERQGGHTRSAVVPLSDDPGQIRSGFNESTRRQVRKAETMGVEVRDLVTDHDLDAFVRVYRKMASTRGAQKLSRGHFRRFRDLVRAKPSAGLFLVASLDDRILGGVAVLSTRATAWYMYGASDFDFREVPLTFLCHWEAMVRLGQAGVGRYDLGGLGEPDDAQPAIAGINRFKLGFSKTVVTSTPEHVKQGPFR